MGRRWQRCPPVPLPSTQKHQQSCGAEGTSKTLLWKGLSEYFLHRAGCCGHQAIFSLSKNILELNIKLLSLPLQEKENMPLPGQGQRPWRKRRGRRQTAERNREEPGHAWPFPQPPPALLKPRRIRCCVEAPLSIPYTGATTFYKTPQEGNCSSLPTPELLQKRQSSAGKVPTTSRKSSEEREMVHF